MLLSCMSNHSKCMTFCLILCKKTTKQAYYNLPCIYSISLFRVHLHTSAYFREDFEGEILLQ